MFWKKWITDIKEKTANMNKEDTCSYIMTYYWPHMLLGILIIALIFLFGAHYLFGNKKPVFTCVMPNQKIDIERDTKMAETFAEYAELDPKRIDIDSDYNFSYDDVKLEGVNESGYEKFFLKWRNNELDAVIISESMYKYCKELGGKFREIDDTCGFKEYKDEGKCTAVILGKDSFSKKVNNKEDILLLAFPDNGKHKENSKKFLKYMKDIYDGKIGGVAYE